MTWKIIGYGPPSELPVIPDYLLVSQHDVIRCIHKTDPKIASDIPVPGKWELVKGASLFFDGMWCAIEEQGITMFLASDEFQWRSKKSQDIAAEAMGIQGDPLKKLALSASAGRLQGLDVPGLMRRLQASQQPGESLEDTLRRIHKSTIK